MRIRQIKPAFWTDARLAALPPAVRLFYVGLWMLADDAGWLRWDPAQIANELYGYESRGRREKNVATYGDELVAASRVERHDCGHAFIPRLTDHQRFGGPDKRVRTVEKEHAKCSPASPRGSPLMPGTVRQGTVRGGDGEERNVDARKRDETESEFRRRAGLPAFMGSDA